MLQLVVVAVLVQQPFVCVVFVHVCHMVINVLIGKSAFCAVWSCGQPREAGFKFQAIKLGVARDGWHAHGALSERRLHAMKYE